MKFILLFDVIGLIFEYLEVYEQSICCNVCTLWRLYLLNEKFPNLLLRKNKIRSLQIWINSIATANTYRSEQILYINENCICYKGEGFILGFPQIPRFRWLEVKNFLATTNPYCLTNAKYLEHDAVGQIKYVIISENILVFFTSLNNVMFYLLKELICTAHLASNSFTSEPYRSTIINNKVDDRASIVVIGCLDSTILIYTMTGVLITRYNNDQSPFPIPLLIQLKVLGSRVITNTQIDKLNEEPITIYIEVNGGNGDCAAIKIHHPSGGREIARGNRFVDHLYHEVPSYDGRTIIQMSSEELESQSQNWRGLHPYDARTEINNYLVCVAEDHLVDPKFFGMPDPTVGLLANVMSADVYVDGHLTYFIWTTANKQIHIKFLILSVRGWSEKYSTTINLNGKAYRFKTDGIRLVVVVREVNGYSLVTISLEPFPHLLYSVHMPLLRRLKDSYPRLILFMNNDVLVQIDNYFFCIIKPQRMPCPIMRRIHSPSNNCVLRLLFEHPQLSQIFAVLPFFWNVKYSMLSWITSSIGLLTGKLMYWVSADPNVCNCAKILVYFNTVASCIFICNPSLNPCYGGYSILACIVSLLSYKRAKTDVQLSPILSLCNASLDIIYAALIIFSVIRRDFILAGCVWLSMYVWSFLWIAVICILLFRMDNGYVCLRNPNIFGLIYFMFTPERTTLLAISLCLLRTVDPVQSNQSKTYEIMVNLRVVSIMAFIIGEILILRIRSKYMCVPKIMWDSITFDTVSMQLLPAIMPLAVRGSIRLFQ